MGETIVVGTDGSESARKAVAEAVRLGKALDASLHIVAAYEPVRGAHVSGAPQGAARVWEPMIGGTDVDSVTQEAEAAARIAGVSAQTHAVRKDPADALLEVAENVGATLIVLGNRGMHGGKRLLGSVPNTVSHRARCNVLIVATDV